MSIDVRALSGRDIVSSTIMDQPSQQDLMADELLLARAEANGYQRGAHKEADEVCGRMRPKVISCKSCDFSLHFCLLQPPPLSSDTVT